MNEEVADAKRDPSHDLSVSLNVGIRPEQKKVALVVDVSGPNSFKLVIDYDPDEAVQLATHLAKAANDVMNLQSGKLVLPPSNGKLKVVRGSPVRDRLKQRRP